MLANRPSYFITNYLVETGAGVFSSWSGDGYYLTNTVTGITGKKRHHLEASLGYAILWNTCNNTSKLIPAGGID